MLIVLALLAAAPVAAGACVPLCAVASYEPVFAPALTVVTSGSTLTWTANDDAAHSATSDDLCLHAYYTPTRPGNATFVVVDGTLVVSDAYREDVACSVAPSADGTFILPYKCLVHPSMQAQLVVK